MNAHDRGEHPLTEAGGETAELRPIENLRVCANCLVSNSASDVFCTACGTRLPSTEESATGASPEREIAAETAIGTRVWPSGQPGEEATVEVSAATKRALGAPRWRWTLVAIAGGALLAAAVTFGVLWQGQRTHAAQLRSQLGRTRVELRSTRSKLASIEAQLQATKSLSEKRRSVLLKTQDVLAKVDPLLSSVDGIQQQSSDLQSQGGVVASDAETLVSTLISLSAYLLEPGTNDYSYVDGLISDANSELSTLRYDESQFGDDNQSYDSASSTFSQKADVFSTAVRKLQKQLKGVSGP